MTGKSILVMLENRRLGAMAAGTLAVAALFTAGPAAAAAAGYGSPSHHYQASVYPRPCRRFENAMQHWVNVCRTYSYRYADPRHVQVYPHYYPYRYRYQPPVTDGGPYYGHEPYGGYQSSFGFSF